MPFSHKKLYLKEQLFKPRTRFKAYIMNSSHPHFNLYLKSLKDSPFFNGVDPQAVEKLYLTMKSSIWLKGTFGSGNDGSTFLHFITSGRLRMFQINPRSGREHTIMILTKGDVFDMLSFMDSEVHEIYYEAIDEIEILFLPIIEMHKWLGSNSEANRAILSYTAKRLRQVEQIASSICLNNTLVRLSNLLLQNMNYDSQQLEMINNLSNFQIASLIGTTRAVVNRHLQELKSYGAISLNRKHISVEKINILESISRETYLN